MNNINSNPIITIPIKIGGQTMVAFGNCFDLVDDKGKYHRVANFCVENLKAWMQQSGLDNVRVRCIPKSDTIWEIADERIPKELYNEQYCKVCVPYRLLPFEQRKKYLKNCSFKKIYNEDGTTDVRLSKTYQVQITEGLKLYKGRIWVPCSERKG